MEKSTIRIRGPLTFSTVFIFSLVGASSLFDPLGFWKYIILGISVFIIVWLLGKLKITEKKVEMGVGILIILLGIAIGITCGVYLE